MTRPINGQTGWNGKYMKLMQKITLVVLGLCLAGCGTFAVQVEVLPDATQTLSPAETSPVAEAASPTPVTASTAVPADPAAAVSAAPTVVPPDEAVMMTFIQMSDTSHGWGVESAGRILKTSDGGGTWKDVTPPAGKYDSHGLAAFNQETVWVVPAQLDVSNMVWRTQDGGTTWVASQPVPLGTGKFIPLSLQFPDAGHGWLLVQAVDGGQQDHIVLYRSDDGGASWVPVSNLDQDTAQHYLPLTSTSMAFFDGQTGWLGGWWGKEDPGQWLMLKTDNGGVKWGTDSLRLPAQKAVQCNGHPVMGMTPNALVMDVTCVKSTDAKYRFHHIYFLSVNSGPEWLSWSLPTEFKSVYFMNAAQGWMMVSSDNPSLNAVMFTHDGGSNWDKVSEVNWKDAQFNFVSDRIGWAVVSNGYATGLMRTENGGKLWIQVRPAIVH